MAGAILIIEIGPRSVSAGLFPSRGKAAASYATAPLPQRNALKDALAGVLSGLGEAGMAAFERAYLSIHPSILSLRVIDVPFEDRRRISEVAPFELSGSLASGAEDMAVDAIPLAGGRSLAVAIEADTLRGYIEALGVSGVDPAWIGSAALAVPYLAEELYTAGGTKAVVGRDYLAVSSGGRPAFVNAFEGGDGLRLNVEYLRAEGVAVDEVYSSGWPLEELEAIIPEASTFAELKAPGGYPAEGAHLCALAMLIRNGFLKETVNFRKGEFVYTKERVELRGKLRLTVALAASIAVLFATAAFLRYSSMSRTAEAHEGAIRASYAELFPGQRPPAGEIFSLEAKLKALEREKLVLAGEESALAVMSAVARASAAQDGGGIRLSELVLGEGRVLLKGTSQSFEAANVFKDAVLKDGLFSEAVITDIRSKKEGLAEFNMAMAVRAR